jgi:hypothetical protein
MKAEMILSLYLGLQKAVVKVEAAVKNSIKTVIESIGVKEAKVLVEIEKDTVDFDTAMNEVSQKFIDKGIVTTIKLHELAERKKELQGLL